MSLMIHGVSMPKDNQVLLIDPLGNARLFRGQEVPVTKTGLFVGKAVELPPHGRLGDLDALAAKDNADYEDAMASIADVSSRSIVCLIHYAAQKMIAEAPTIIPAGPEGGGISE